MKIIITDKLKKRRAETLGFDVDIGLVSRLKLHGTVEGNDEIGIQDLFTNQFVVLSDIPEVDKIADAAELNEEVDNDSTD